jgi:hypothetical protein
MEAIDGRLEKLIGEAVMAGAYREAIREDPALAAGFGKLAAKHSARVAAFAQEITADARRAETDAASAFISPRRL